MYKLIGVKMIEDKNICMCTYVGMYVCMYVSKEFWDDNKQEILEQKLFNTSRLCNFK